MVVFKPEWWSSSDRNGGRLQAGIVVAFRPESVVGMLQNMHIKMISFNKIQTEGGQNNKIPPFFCALAIGGIIGFISGLVGVGGGIFLAPILYLLKWGTPKKIAAASSLFILINSISGLIGQIQKSGDITYIGEYVLLVVSVFLGGQVGSWLCNYQFSHRKIEIFTSTLLFFVSTKIFVNILW